MAPHNTPTPGLTSVAGGSQRAPELEPAPFDPPTPPNFPVWQSPRWKKYWKHMWESEQATIEGRPSRYLYPNWKPDVPAEPSDPPRLNENVPAQPSDPPRRNKKNKKVSAQARDMPRRNENVPAPPPDIPRRNGNIPLQPHAIPRQNEIVPFQPHDIPRQNKELTPQQFNHFQPSGNPLQTGYPLPVPDVQRRTKGQPVLRNFVQTQSENIPREHPYAQHLLHRQQVPVQNIHGYNAPVWNENIPPQHFHQYQPSGHHQELRGLRVPPLGPRRNESHRLEPYARPKTRHGPIPRPRGATKAELVTAQTGYYDHRPQIQWNQQQQVNQNAGSGTGHPGNMPQLHSWLRPLPPKRPSNNIPSRPNTSHGQGIQQQQPAHPLGGMRRNTDLYNRYILYPEVFNPYRFGDQAHMGLQDRNNAATAPTHQAPPSYDNHHGKNHLFGENNNHINHYHPIRPTTPTPPRPIPTSPTRLRPHPPKTDTQQEPTGESTDEDQDDPPVAVPLRRPRKVDPVQRALSLGRHSLPTSRPAQFNADLSRVKSLDILRRGSKGQVITYLHG